MGYESKLQIKGTMVKARTMRRFASEVGNTINLAICLPLGEIQLKSYPQLCIYRGIKDRVLKGGEKRLRNDSPMIHEQGMNV
jgi:hypothetical protein